MRFVAPFLLLPLAFLLADDDMKVDNYTIETGYTREHLTYSFSANGISPQSELSFKESEFVYTKLSLEHKFEEGRIAGIYMGLGKALDGYVQDSDYGASGRSKEYSRSISSTDDSSFIEAGVIFGEEIELDDRLSFIPKAEYAFLYQKYTIKDGEQVLSDNANVPVGLSNPPAVGTIAGLNSSYESYWQTGYLGSDIEYDIGEKTTLALGAYAGLGYYYGVGHWNLSTDFKDKSFEHTGMFYAGKFSIGLKYKIDEDYEIYGNYRYSYARLKDGDNVQFLTDGTKPRSNLDEVKRVENRFSTGLNCKF